MLGPVPRVQVLRNRRVWMRVGVGISISAGVQDRVRVRFRARESKAFRVGFLLTSSSARRAGGWDALGPSHP